MPRVAHACHILSESLVHGHDIARAQRVRWTIEPAHAGLALMGFAFPLLGSSTRARSSTRRAHGGSSARYDIDVRGAGHVFLAVGDGAVTVQPQRGERVDCHLSADPPTLLLLLFGRISQWPALLTGRLFAWGASPGWRRGCARCCATPELRLSEATEQLNRRLLRARGRPSMQCATAIGRQSRGCPPGRIPGGSMTPPSPTLAHGRHPERGTTDMETIHAILDAERICHVAFVVDGWPYAVPTIHARDGDRLLLHGSTLSRMLGSLAAGVPVCVTVTAVDGIVCARSAFNHSMNYRCAMVFGTATADPRRRREARGAADHRRARAARTLGGGAPAQAGRARATEVVSLPTRRGHGQGSPWRIRRHACRPQAARVVRASSPSRPAVRRRR